MRLSWLLLLLFLACAARAMTPRVVVWREGGRRFVAAVDGRMLHLATVLPTGLKDAGAVAAPEVTTLAVVDGGLLGIQGTRLLRLEVTAKRWREIGTAPAAVREVLPAPAGGCYLRTGGSGTAPADGAVWWVRTRPYACRRVTAVPDGVHPWRLWWVGDHLAVAMAASITSPGNHEAFALFTARNETVEPYQSDVPLIRPCVDVAAAALHADGVARVVTVEVTADGGRGLSFYAPTATGYIRETFSESLPGLEHLVAFTRINLYAFGHDAAGKPLVWIVVPYGDGYGLTKLPVAPPAPDAAVLLYNDTGVTLTGWWNGRWQQLLIAR